jgi:hypothetical protein
MNGILGTWNIYSGIPQAIYVNNYSDAAMVSVNICNKNNREVKINLSISTSATSPGNGEYIEYETTILGKGVLTRTGIMVSPGQYIVVESSREYVNATCWGIETGAISGSPVALTQNSGAAPSWVTSASLSDLTSSSFVTITLEAS